MAAETYRICLRTEVEDKTGPGLASATKRVSAFDKVVQQTQSRLNKMTGSRWSMAIGAVDKATSVITKVESKIHGAVGKAWNFTVGVVDKATAPIQGIFNLLKNPILQAGAVLGISVSASDAISTFGGFEATMSKVKAISGAEGQDFEDLTALAKEMGATTKFTAQEAAEGLTYMAMAGWKTEDMLTSLSGVMNLAAASGEDLATVSDIVTDAMTAFGMSASGYTEDGIANATHFADVLAVASSNANTNVAMMGETFKYVGAASGALGYSIEDVALGIGLMANAGIKASQGGTELNSIFTRLATNTNGARDAIEEMGISFYTSTGDARAFGDILGELRTATQGMTKEQKMNFANTVAGQRAQAGLLAMLNATEEDYHKLTEAIEDCDGAAEEMAGTMLDNLQGSLTLLGSAVDGVKMSLGSRLSPYVRQFADWLTTKMPAVEDVINSVMDTVDAKVEALKGTIAKFTSSDEWANADIWGKISIAWDKIVAEPFSQWWESSGKPWLTEKVAGFGETLGSGITAGLLAILGFDASGAVEDGMSIGTSFIDGFMQGFDGEQITRALKQAFETFRQEHPVITVALGAAAGAKTLVGASKVYQKGKGIFDTVSGFFGNGKSGGSSGVGDILKSFTSNTMMVTAGTVIVNGSGTSNAVNTARNAVQQITGGGGQSALPGAAGAGRLALPGATGGALGSVGTALGNVAGTLGSGATTAAGAAAVGAGSIAGAAGGILGLGSAAIDLFQGFGKQKEGDAKGAQDEFVTAGTKTGMVGAGAATGAAIGAAFGGVGAIPGALIGAGVGGLGALFGGDSLGKKLSDSLDEGGAINTIWQNLKTGAGDAWESIKAGASSVGDFVSEKWDSIKEGAASIGTAVSEKWSVLKEGAESIGAAVSEKWNQASETVSEKWGALSSWFGENVWTPISDAGISAINIATGAWISITEPIKEKFGELSAWFGENVWEPIKTGAQEAGQWVSDRWTEAKAWASETWQTFSGWFEESVWTPVKEGAQAAGEWIGNKWAEAKQFASDTWQAFSGWFEESVWAPVKEGARAAGEWVGNEWSEAKTFVSDTWQTFSGWFDESVWTPVKEGARAAGEWVGNKWSEAKTAISEGWHTFSSWFEESVWTPVKEGARVAGEWIGSKLEEAKSGIQTAWTGVSSWFGENVWGPIKSAASDAWGFVKEKWQGAKDWIAGFGEKGSQATGLTTSQGKSTILAHATGGIMTQPHMGLVAEDGPEAIIPLGASSRSRGMAIWEKAGDILGANNSRLTGSGGGIRPVGSNDDGIGDLAASSGKHAEGGIMHAPHMAQVAENGPEAIIPLGTSSRSRGMAIWEEAGDILGINNPALVGSNDNGLGDIIPEGNADGYSGPQRGGYGEDAPVYSPDTPERTESAGASQDTPVSVQVSITVNPEIIVQAAQGMNTEDIVAILKERIRDMVDDISDEMAEKLARIFANMPVKGGA